MNYSDSSVHDKVYSDTIHEYRTTILAYVLSIAQRNNYCLFFVNSRTDWRIDVHNCNTDRFRTRIARHTNYFTCLILHAGVFVCFRDVNSNTRGWNPESSGPPRMMENHVYRVATRLELSDSRGHRSKAIIRHGLS